MLWYNDSSSGHMKQFILFELSSLPFLQAISTVNSEISPCPANTHIHSLLENDTSVPLRILKFLLKNQREYKIFSNHFNEMLAD